MRKEELFRYFLGNRRISVYTNIQNVHDDGSQ
jgi:hypothetical protein